MKIVVPEYPLAPGSVEIIPKTPIKNFSEWKSSNELETYKLIKDIAQVWEKSGVTDYLVYGKESAHSKSTFGWEVIPYKKEGWRSWKQFKVLWNMTFGSSYASLTERQQVAKDFQKEGALFSQPLIKQIEAIKEVVKGDDVFCNPRVIEKSASL
jgi:diadenosine tetraphosphate (Ap4A) HIT family hydrolase